MKASPAPGSDGSDEPAFEDESASDAGPPDVGTVVVQRDARGRSGIRRWLKLAVAAALVAAILCAVGAYHRLQERRIVAASISRADQLMRSDTWLGYHEAAMLLGVRAAALDPVRAGAMRARALAMLALDYRDDGAMAEARAALVAPERSDEVPAPAYLAAAALALRGGLAGTALERLSRASASPEVQVLTARVALLAGNGAVALEATGAALGSDPRLPSALALRGDLLRRAGRFREARDAYAAALVESAQALRAGLEGSSARPGAAAPHARATFGLGKLALSREAPVPEATSALGQVVDDVAGTPQVERARAAMLLAALQARLGDRVGASATIDKAGLAGDLRAWLEKASGQLEVTKGAYRVPDATPAVLLSASDDDPYAPPPAPAKHAPAPPPKRVLYGFKVHPLPKTPPPTRRAPAHPARRPAGQPAPTGARP